MAGTEAKTYLVYRARDKTLRTLKGQRNGRRNDPPILDWDEVAFEVTVNVPDAWGRVAGAIVVDLPENGPPVIEITREDDPPSD